MMIDDIIKNLQSISTIGQEIAQAAAPKLQELAKARASAGVDPYGKAWAPKKKGGGRALAHAADHVRAEASGNIVTLVVDGAEYWHQSAKEGASLPQRKIIPAVGDPLPPEMQAALDATAREVIAKRMGGT